MLVPTSSKSDREWGRLLGFIESDPGYPDDLSELDEEERWENIEGFVTDFARSNWGQQTLSEIDEFGLPHVDSAADITPIQSLFLRLARNERNRRQRQRNR